MMSEQSKMGRPKKLDAKVKPVQVRFGETEFEMIKVSAAKRNMTITEFVREASVKLAKRTK